MCLNVYVHVCLSESVNVYMSVCVCVCICVCVSMHLSLAELPGCLVACLGKGLPVHHGPWSTFQGAREVARKAGHSPLLPAQVPLKVSLSAGRSWGHLVPLQGAPGPTNVPPSLQATSGPRPAPERRPPRLHFLPSFGP